VASRPQLTRLAQRIEELAARVVPADGPPPEWWVVDGDRAYELSNPEDVMTVAEMEARPTKRTSFPTRIVYVSVYPAHTPGQPPLGGPTRMLV